MKRHRPHFRKWLEQFITEHTRLGALARAALNDKQWLNAGYTNEKGLTKTLGFDPNVLALIMASKGASDEEMRTLDEAKDRYIQTFAETYR